MDLNDLEYLELPCRGLHGLKNGVERDKASDVLCIFGSEEQGESKKKWKLLTMHQ